ncbi:MAG: hypothetical protein RIG82_09210 [Phycisphaeraceae bacterium]
MSTNTFPKTLLAEARDAGVSVWLDGDRLRARVRPETPEDLVERLRREREPITAMLVRAEVGTILRRLRSLSRGRAIAARDAWDERVAIVTVDGGGTEIEGMVTALAEIREDYCGE